MANPRICRHIKMLLSSPYSIHEAAYQNRWNTGTSEESPFHPATQSRITLLECLESRGFDYVFELHWPSKVALQWNLAEKKVVAEVKWLAVDEQKNSSFVTFDLLSMLDLESCFIEDLLFIAYNTRNNNFVNVTCVFWPQKAYTKSSLDEICISYLIPKCIFNVIVVSDQPVKPQCSVVFQHRGIDHTFFSYDDLKFNITKHLLVPKYRIVPYEQLTSVGIKPIDMYRLPTLLKSDPICVFFGWREGTILQIESIMGKPAPEFRIVRSDHTYKGPYHSLPAFPPPAILPPTSHTTVTHELLDEKEPTDKRIFGTQMNSQGNGKNPMLIYKQHNIREFLKS